MATDIMDMEKSTRPAQYLTDYDGIMWPTMVTRESLKAIKDFEMWENDIWIATYPKAGTHWVSEICSLINNKGEIQDDRLLKPLEFALESTHHQSDAGPPYYKTVSTWTPPRVIISHVPFQYLPSQLLGKGNGKVIYVIRNPKDSMVSIFYFLKGMTPGASETFSQYLYEHGTSEKAPYGTWFNHVLGYWAQRNHKQFLILKYEEMKRAITYQTSEGERSASSNIILKFEEMKRDTRGAVIQIADFMGRPLSDEIVDKIVGLTQLKSMKERFHSAGENKGKKGAFNLMRKGIVGDWKTHFTVAGNEAFDALYRQKMAGSGLQLQFE